jgi:WD40 repeat protein
MTNGFDTQLLYFTCSSLSRDDKRIYLISNRNGNPNVYVRDLTTGEEISLTDNQHGILKSYVYFDGNPGMGLGKASVCLDCDRDIVYYIQDNLICKVGLDKDIHILNQIPEGRMTAFTHVSSDGKLLCVPMTDGRILEYDPDTEGYGLDKRPVYNIDRRVQDEHLSSYLCVYDTQTGKLLYEKTVPLCWITHVQFNPVNPDVIMFNHEWPSFDCGVRRIWLYDHSKDMITRVRNEGTDTLGNTSGYPRRAADWVCHEMWSDDGKIIIYHGGYADGPAMVGKYELDTKRYWEIALPEEYKAYGHFTMDHQQNLCCDGYFKFPKDIKIVRENSTDNGPDPHKKDGEYVSKVIPRWEEGILEWIPLCKHLSDWLGQDAHPHPVYNHQGNEIYFNSRSNLFVEVFKISIPGA